MSFTPSYYNGTTQYTYAPGTGEPNTGRGLLRREHTTRFNGPVDNVFKYDLAGNPLTYRLPEFLGDLPYNANNQRTGFQTYVYDGNGNPTTYRNVTGLTYDAENRLTGYNNGAITFGYDGDGLRAWKRVGSTYTYYLYDGTDLISELNAAGTVTASNYFGANGLIQRTSGGVKRFYAFDPQGSVANVIFSATSATAVGFDAYGKRYGDAATDPWGYGAQWGYYTDNETGLNLCTHRYYDPATGRWLTRDPIGYAGGVNLYGYVGGDPVNHVDPSGKEPCSINNKIQFFESCVATCKAILQTSLQNTKLGESICKGICMAWTYKGNGSCEWLDGYCLKKRSTGWYAPCCNLHAVMCTGGKA